MTKNAPAGFWIRLLTKILDFAWVAVASVGILFALLEKKQHYQFKEEYGYYVWTIITVALIILSFIIVPYLTKGRTLAMYLTKIRIVQDDKSKLLVSLLKRELMFSLAWSFMLLLAMALINHTLVNEFARPDQSKVTYTTWQQLRIGVVSTVGTVVIVLQMLSVIGIIIKKNKKGFHDNLSQTSTVWINKFLTQSAEKEIKKIHPRPVNDEIVEWV